LSSFLDVLKAREGASGRAPYCPRMMLTLWMYGLSQGITQAREIVALCETDPAFAWIVGGVDVKHGALSQFFRARSTQIRELLEQHLRRLHEHGRINLDTAAIDGTKVRADAATASFRQRPALEDHREYTQLHQHAVTHAPAQEGVTEASKRVRKAQARGMARRAEQALDAVNAMADKQRRKSHKTKAKRRQPRASTTDPDARIMKFPNGDFAPGYNVQFAVVGNVMGGPRAIIGMDIVQSSSDGGCLTPMRKSIRAALGVEPRRWLADGVYASRTCIQQAEDDDVELIIPVGEAWTGEDGPDTAIGRWKARWSTDAARRVYRHRASLVELVNAHMKSLMNLARVWRRGLENIKTLFRLAALAYNVVALTPRPVK
jgi:transposase